MSEVTRYSVAPKSFQDDLSPAHIDSSGSSDQSPKVHSGSLFYTAGGDDPAQQGGSVKFTESQDGTAGGSVVATLRRAGPTPSVELYPGRPESRTSVEVAARMGLIKRDSFGQWQDADAAAQVAQSETPAPVGDSAEDFTPAESQAFTPEADAAFQALVNDVPQHSFDSAMAGVIAALGSGTGNLEGVAKRFAESAGMEPSQASQLIDQAIAYYSGAASRVLGGMGMSAGQQDAFFGQLQGPALTQVFQELAYGRSAAKLVEEAGAWRGKNPPDMSAYHAAGFETHVDPRTGEVMLRQKVDGAPWARLSDLEKVQPQQKAAQQQAPQQQQQKAAQQQPAQVNVTPADIQVAKSTNWAAAGFEEQYVGGYLQVRPAGQFSGRWDGWQHPEEIVAQARQARGAR